MRKIYRKKKELFCQLLANCKSKVRYYGEHSGFYLLIEILEQEKTQGKLTALALQKGIAVYPVDYEQRLLFFWALAICRKTNCNKGQFIIGYLAA